MELPFTDTDSLDYLIETDDVYSDMLVESNLYDFSAYPSNHACSSLLSEKKNLGEMEDELDSVL